MRFSIQPAEAIPFLSGVDLISSKTSSQMDYVFRYGLDRTSPPVQNRLLGMVRTQLQNVLDIVTLTRHGKKVTADGFKLLSDEFHEYKLWDRSGLSTERLDSSVIYEPRIQFIKKQLESLLSVIELEGHEKTVPVDGFRLKSLQDWAVRGDCDPGEILEVAASRCNCDCIMCYNKGNPPSIALRGKRRSRAEELREIKTRLDYFSPREGTSLFPNLGCSYEVMAHPSFFKILRLLRGKTSKPIRINTNGKTLTSRRIGELAEFRPIYLYLSLNSSSPERRRRLMRDHRPQTAISAPAVFKNREIPYAVVIVPWPVDSVTEMCKDLYDTAVYADGCGAHLIQINLPGYSRWFSSKREFDLKDVWGACIDTVRDLRGKIACPVVTMPSMFEENLHEERKNLPKIIGLVRNSPAARCGLRLGDILIRINDVSVRTRPQARDLLSMLQKSEMKTAHLSIHRNKNRVDVPVNLEDFSYPFTREFDHHLGIIFMGTGLRMSDIENLRNFIEYRKAKDVLFLSSSLVKPTFEQCLRESHLLSSPEIKIRVRVPRNNYFGGNVFMGDLLVVQDFIDSIKEYLAQGYTEPDLIVIPSSPFRLGGWGRDLTGRVYLEIEREVGIPVDLLACDTIYD